MSCYVTAEKWGFEANRFNAGDKAREDITSILSERAQPITVEMPPRIENSTFKQTMLRHWKIYKQWDSKLSNLDQNSVLVIQFPLICHSMFFSRALIKHRHRGLRIVLIIHDLEILRLSLLEKIPVKAKMRYSLEEKSVLGLADIIIVHNNFMAAKLLELGLVERSQLQQLHLFDYLCRDASQQPIFVRSDSGHPSVVIAGNLSAEKAGYLRHLPSGIDWRIYGAGIAEGEQIANVEYCGKFKPEDGPNVIQGDYGLVWDGCSTQTCEGAFGSYLRYNNPHKASLYLAAGMPIIVWRESALATTVIEKGIGLAISSVDELAQTLSKIPAADYEQMKTAALRESRLIRSGHYTNTAMSKAFKALDLGYGIRG